MASCAVPPQAHSETFLGHAALDAVGSLDGRVLGLRRADGRLIVPLLVNDLQAHHFVGIIKQPLLLVQVPDPKLLRVITAPKNS